MVITARQKFKQFNKYPQGGALERLSTGRSMGVCKKHTPPSPFGFPSGKIGYVPPHPQKLGANQRPTPTLHPGKVLGTNRLLRRVREAFRGAFGSLLGCSLQSSYVVDSLGYNLRSQVLTLLEDL